MKRYFHVLSCSRSCAKASRPRSMFSVDDNFPIKNIAFAHFSSLNSIFIRLLKAFTILSILCCSSLLATVYRLSKTDHHAVYFETVPTFIDDCRERIKYNAKKKW